MNFEPLALAGMSLVWGTPFEDERGVFRRHFCEDSLKSMGIDFSVKQGNLSENPQAGTLRGFHFQKPPHGESKIITVLAGKLWNVTVDLRSDSATYLRTQILELDAAQRQSVVIPAGTANAFLTLEPNTLVHYYMSQNFVPDSYAGFHYADPDLAITWPTPIAHISDKDQALPTLASLGFVK